jgi:hypothetical protein
MCLALADIVVDSAYFRPLLVVEQRQIESAGDVVSREFDRRAYIYVAAVIRFQAGGEG